MNWNQRITERRGALGLTKAAFSRLVGVSGATVTDWESGEIKNLAGENLVKVATVLKVSPEWLLSGKVSTAAPLQASDVVAEYGNHTELLAAWDLLTQDERADFLKQIKERAVHNQAVIEQLTVRRRTVNVNERRLAEAGVSFTDRRERKDGGQ